MHKVTGKKAEVLFEEDIFYPLGMENTYLPPAKAKTIAVTAVGIDYDYLPMGPYWMNPDHTSWTTMAYTSGGTHSSPAGILSARRRENWYSSAIKSPFLKDQWKLCPG